MTGVEAVKRVALLYPFQTFLADDGETWLVSTLTIPQHPICACGTNEDYAKLVCAALSAVAVAYTSGAPIPEPA